MKGRGSTTWTNVSPERRVKLRTRSCNLFASLRLIYSSWVTKTSMDLNCFPKGESNDEGRTLLWTTVAKGFVRTKGCYFMCFQADPVGPVPCNEGTSKTIGDRFQNIKGNQRIATNRLPLKGGDEPRTRARFRRSCCGDVTFLSTGW